MSLFRSSYQTPFLCYFGNKSNIRMCLTISQIRNICRVSWDCDLLKMFGLVQRRRDSKVDLDTNFSETITKHVHQSGKI